MRISTLLGIINQQINNFELVFEDEEGNILKDNKGIPIKVTPKLEKEFTFRLNKNGTKMKNEKGEYLFYKTNKEFNLRLIRKNIENDSKKVHSFDTLKKVYNFFLKDNDFKNTINKITLEESKQVTSYKLNSTISCSFKFNPTKENQRLDQFLLFFSMPTTWKVLDYINDIDNHYKIPEQYKKQNQKMQENGFVSKGYIGRALKISPRTVFDNLQLLEKQMGLTYSKTIGKLRWVNSIFNLQDLEKDLNVDSDNEKTANKRRTETIQNSSLNKKDTSIDFFNMRESII